MAVTTSRRSAPGESGPAPSGTRGRKIVLTASASEISNYEWSTFSAFMASFPAKFLQPIVDYWWYAPDDHQDGRARFMPMGLRKVESLLLQEYPAEDVVAVHPKNLHRVVGPDTKILAVTTMNPLGLAYVDTTYSSIFALGGKSVNSVEFRRIFDDPSVRKHDPTILLGGAGAWQIDRARMREELGIDCVVYGEAEEILVDLFRKALRGETLPAQVHGEKPMKDHIPPIRHATVYGVVEMMRGCGRMCDFCSPTLRRKLNFPKEFILKEVEVNVREGSRMILMNSDDIFLYKCSPGFIPNREAIVDVFKAVSEHPGVEMIQLSHASLAPVVYDQKLLTELTPHLIEKTRWSPKWWKGYSRNFISVEVGIETGSVRMMKKHLKGKALPYAVDGWKEMVPQAIGIFNDNDWWPLGTMMTGLPDETDDDVMHSLEMIDDMKGQHVFLTPLVFVPLEDCLLNKASRVDLTRLTEAQWHFVASCWRHNVDVWYPHAKPWVTMISMLSYALYYRKVHGSKIRRPFMRIAGLPDIQYRPIDGCEPELCFPEHVVKEEHRRRTKEKEAFEELGGESAAMSSLGGVPILNGRTGSNGGG